MIAYCWTGVDADGNMQSCTTARPLTEEKLRAVVRVFQARGWTDVAGTDYDGNLVAGTKDLGFGRHEAWAVAA
jgi:hypothetical protein